MTGAEILLECLEIEGISYIFGNPGTTEVAILDALVEKSAIQYVLTLHESVAVAMADGYARAGGGVGFANVHTALGTANAIGGLHSAYVGRTPLILTAATKDSRILGRDSFSEVPDLLGMTRQFTKWSWQVLRPEKIGEDLFRAFKIASSPPCGPVFLAIPEDFLAQEMEVDIPLSHRFKFPIKMRAMRQQIEQAVKLLLQAERPLMIAGNEIAKTGAIPEAIALAELLALPVVTEGRHSLAFLNFPTKHPLYRGVFDRQSEYVQCADLVLGIGCRLLVEEAQWEGPDILQQVKTIHLQSDPAEIGRRYPVEAPIVTDVKQGLMDLIDAARRLISEEQTVQFRKRFRELKEEEGKEELSKSSQIQAAWGKKPITLEQLIKEINDTVNEDAIIVDEAIRSSRPLLKLYNFSRSGTYFRSPSGYLGWGLPSSLGIRLASPGRQVVAFVGDGAFFFSAQALWTAAKCEIPVVVVVCNNRGYRAVKDAAIRFKGIAAERSDFVGSSIDKPAPSLAKIADGFGVSGTCIREPGEIRPALVRALQSGKPAVLDVIIE